MYRIIQKLDGTFRCEVTIQDGTERWTEKTLEDAKINVKQSAWILNHDKIKKKSIEIYREEPVTETRVVRIN